MDNFIFDVDGTLTPSRGVIDPEFKKFFLTFQEKYNVYLVTGSDRQKTIEQVGIDVYNSCRLVFNCSGNSMWIGDRNVYNSSWELPETPWKYLETKLIHSKFSPKTGWHFDVRPGLLNFSILGRKATEDQRKLYVEWDTKTQEREEITTEFNAMFQEKYKVQATIGGETGIDISGIGLDKSRILTYYDETPVSFFGDRMEIGGNDYPLKKAIEERNLQGDVCYHVSDWQHTWKILQDTYWK